MVYRGKPSAGCENCRRAKKRCDLERPACLRCVKLNKTCSGYRDTTSLQIQDETGSVKQKAEQQKAKSQWQHQYHPQEASRRSANPPVQRKSTSPPPPPPLSGLLTPSLTESNPPTPGMAFNLATPDIEFMDTDDMDFDDPVALTERLFGPADMGTTGLWMQIKPKPDDIATNYFFYQFTSGYHWQFLRGIHTQTLDPCLELAMKACGMAALDNVQNVVMGREYSRSMYAEALGLLNGRLRDPKQCKTDSSLIAVSMLGYYENLTCEGRGSIHSWKAHVRGAAQLLKIRGPGQFKSYTGRSLFREIRAQIIIMSLWDDAAPPEFLWGYQPALEAETEEKVATGPTDQIVRLCIEFGALRAEIRKETITEAEAARQAAELERRFIQWQIDTSALDERWQYYEVEVMESEHIWNGKVFAYSGHPMPTAWNTWRSIRIMLSRTQEWLSRRLHFSESERNEQVQYFRRVRRQLADDICATIPVQLGHSSPAYTSPCVLITAYSSIWPLFFAGTVVFERVGASNIVLRDGRPQLTQTVSAAATQAVWILDRLRYISKHIGLRWAEGVAATLKGDFHVYDNALQQDTDFEVTTQAVAKGAAWIENVEKAKDSRWLIEPADGIGDILIPEERRPIWLGRQVEAAENYRNLTSAGF